MECNYLSRRSVYYLRALLIGLVIGTLVLVNTTLVMAQEPPKSPVASANDVIDIVLISGSVAAIVSIIGLLIALYVGMLRPLRKPRVGISYMDASSHFVTDDVVRHDTHKSGCVIPLIRVSQYSKSPPIPTTKRLTVA